ncbi:MAG TPA: CPXCG motif-containing cysteine-rich protein [Rhodanobacteraceae bacterium]|nr:CPXCG motif-containing cysteine-rich protein [Rhodanobacteraceae bacterium]
MSEFVSAHCPYCGEPIELLVDTSVPAQDYVEDCQVCCRPIAVAVTTDEAGRPQVSLRSQDET